MYKDLNCKLNFQIIQTQNRKILTWEQSFNIILYLSKEKGWLHKIMLKRPKNRKEEEKRLIQKCMSPLNLVSP